MSSEKEKSYLSYVKLLDSEIQKTNLKLSQHDNHTFIQKNLISMRRSKAKSNLLKRKLFRNNEKSFISSTFLDRPNDTIQSAIEKARRHGFTDDLLYMSNHLSLNHQKLSNIKSKTEIKMSNYQEDDCANITFNVDCASTPKKKIPKSSTPRVTEFRKRIKDSRKSISNKDQLETFSKLLVKVKASNYAIISKKCKKQKSRKSVDSNDLKFPIKFYPNVMSRDIDRAIYDTEFVLPSQISSYWTANYDGFKISYL